MSLTKQQLAEQHAKASHLMLMGNATQQQAIRSQIAAAISGGYDFGDTLHNIYQDYGYPATLTFTNYWNMYRRFGIARRGVELYPDQTWLDDPIVTGGGQFERELEKLVRQRKLWRRLKGLDVRQRVGRYAGMFMRVRDGKMPSEPVAGRLSGVDALVDMVPLYESQLQVVTTENDPKADNYAQPTMYQYNGAATGSRNEREASSFEIHPSRIIIAAEGSDNGGIYGIPAQECVYNSLMDLRKVLGAGGEGFYKNAAQNIVFNLQDPSTAKTNEALLDKFNENYDDFAANRQRRSMWTPGMDAKTLESSLVNPKDFAANCLLDISAGFNTPLALLVGNQEGRLAGDQDTKGFLRQVQARREDFGDDMVANAVEWCQRWGVLPSAEVTIEWPDATEASDLERLTNADKMADTNQKQFQSGGDAVYSAEEIRLQAGFEVEVEGDLPEPDESLDDADTDEG